MTTLTCTAQYDGTLRDDPRSFNPVEGGATVRIEADLRTVAPADAPVAARVPQSYAFPSAPESDTTDVRLFEGSFFRQLRYWQGLAITPQIVKNAPTGGFFLGIYRTEDEALTALHNIAANFILIDGECWERTTEPVIGVRSSGLIVRTAGEARGSEPTYLLTEAAAAFDAAQTITAPKFRAAAPAIEILIRSAFTAPE